MIRRLGEGRLAGPQTRLRKLAALPVSVLVLPMLFAAGAGAATPRLAAYGSFHAEGSTGVAVDQATGDVFTTGFLTTREREREETPGEREHVRELSVFPYNQKFTATGELLSPPSPFGEALHFGDAVNPTNGRLYVANAFGVIEIVDPNTGQEISSFGVPPFFTTFQGLITGDAQIAADSAGNVYVPNAPGNEVLEYNEAGTQLVAFTGAGEHALAGPTGVAVDATGNVWVADNGNNRIEEFSPTGTFLSEFESEGVRALAPDGHGDLFAIVFNGADDCGAVGPPCQHLVEYDKGGAQLADVGAGYIGLGGEYKQDATSMVAIDEANGRAYVSDGLKNTVWAYQPPAAPVVGQESAAEVSASDAKLSALVQPGGITTSYRFEYDTREYREGEGPHGVSVPSPEGSAGEGFSQRVVWASAKDLTPGATYYYRVVATNALGTAIGLGETFTTQTIAQTTCPNELARSGFSAGLSECRAYELVTPPGKSSAQPDSVTETIFDEELGNRQGTGYVGGMPKNVAATDGNRFAYISAEVMNEALTPGLEFIATRGPDGWTTQDALPLRPYTANRCTFPVSSQTEVLRYSPDLTTEVLVDNASDSGKYSSLFAEGCRGEAVEVVPNEPFEQNLLARDNETGRYQLVDVTPSGIEPEPADFVAASADLNVVVFSERAKLTADAVSGAANLYEWNEGTLRLLKLQLPSGAPADGSIAGISEDGAALIFTAGGNLYARTQGRTVQVDEARGGAGPGGGGELMAVSGDGAEVFFTDEATAGLTSNTVAGSGENLYRYDVSSGELSDLTPVSDAQANFIALAQDGSYVYFSSDSVQSGTETNQLGEGAQRGQPNLYVQHDGATTFVMSAANMVPPINQGKKDAVSQSGAYLAFDATRELTGYDNSGRHEIYLYSAATDRFKCASCDPTGEAPVKQGATLGDAPHEVSNNGQVFFETNEVLLPRDTNGESNVYEFNYATGLHLISTGAGAGASVLLDASVSGDDVFFLTPESLVAEDNGQEAHKIYDARIDGGFPEAAAPPPCTTADACRAAATPQPSAYGTPSSQTFSGDGNLAPAAKSKPKRPKHRRRRECERRRAKRRHASCAAKHKRHNHNKPKAKSHRGGK